MTKTIITASEEGWYIEGKPLVKCKDCKHSVPDIVGDKIEGYECDFCYDSYWDANDFCSRGEKR